MITGTGTGTGMGFTAAGGSGVRLQATAVRALSRPRVNLVVRDIRAFYALSASSRIARSSLSLSATGFVLRLPLGLATTRAMSICA